MAPIRAPVGSFPNSTSVRVESGPSGQLGAAPGTFGLIDPANVPSHTPINISGNSAWTAAHGVRYGAGTQANPYVIENWTIDMLSYPSNVAAVWVHSNSTVFGIIRNVKITNLGGNGNYFAILLGTNAYPPAYNADRADNVVVTRIEIHQTTAYGIEASYGTNNDTISYSAIFMNITSKDFQYGATCQGGTFYCKIIGNYVDARNNEPGPTYTKRTVGIQLGDQRDKDAPACVSRPCWREASYGVAKYNTVTNATGTAVVSDTMYKGQIFGNLVYQNYPGRRDISGWTSRGILVENFANYTQVHDNEVSMYKNAIQPGAWAGWYWSNSVHDSDWGIYISTNGSFYPVSYTLYNVVWNTKHYNDPSGNFHIPANEFTTILDVTGTPTTTYFPISFTNQAGRTMLNVQYAVAGVSPTQSLNISYSLNSQGNYMPPVAIYYISSVSSFAAFMSCQWYGSATTVSVSKFEQSNITFTPTFSGTSTMNCSYLWPYSYYLVERNWIQQQNVTVLAKGIITVTLTGPFTTVYALVRSGSCGCGPQPNP